LREKKVRFSRGGKKKKKKLRGSGDKNQRGGKKGKKIPSKIDRKTKKGERRTGGGRFKRCFPHRGMSRGRGKPGAKSQVPARVKKSSWAVGDNKEGNDYETS